jgi:uncharacterized protein (DUF302 family)
MQTYECVDSAEDTAQVLITSIELNKMRLVAHINGQANAAKIGKTVPADQILEVFRPDFAVRVWQACKPAGIDIPLRIHIYENEAGKTIVTFRTASEIFAPYNNAALMEIGKELDAIFTSILDAVVIDAEEMLDG